MLDVRDGGPSAESKGEPLCIGSGGFNL